MGNEGTCEEGNSSIQPGGTAIKLNKDVEFKVIKLEKNMNLINTVDFNDIHFK